MERQPLTCEQLVALSETDRIYMAEFATILENFSGCTSPAEEFIVNLVSAHAYGNFLTPDDASDELKDFRRSFDTAIAAARDLLQKHPGEVIGADRCGGWNAQVAVLKADERDEQQEAFQLEMARRAIRKYPSLLLADEMPQPWKGIMEQFEAERKQKQEG
ncbi:MAG: hypothetical protein M3N93_10025 [Acidobacteriota bacterium]|nr:hypothetical protein [Acidobacteriota bacterium]